MLVKSNYEQAIDVVKPGNYNAFITGMNSYVSKQGTECVRVTAKIVDEPYRGRIVPVILPIEGKAAGFFRKFVQVFRPEYFEGLIDTDEFINQPLKLEIQESKSSNGLRSYNKNFFHRADESTRNLVREFLSEILQEGAQ